MIGDGKNRIPMIHAADLSTIVKYLVHESPNDLEYINAIDFAPNRSQTKLITTISEAMGGQEVQQLSYLDAVFSDDYNLLTLNVNLIPTDVMGLANTLTGNESQDEQRLAAVQQTFAEGEKKQYKWKYRSGFIENFDAVYSEFKVYRNLKTIKLICTGLGLPTSSLYGEEISKMLRVPYISYDSLIAEVSAKDDPLGKSVRDYLETEKNKMIAAATEELEKLKAKKKLKPGQPDTINPDDYVPKLNLTMINKIFSWRLGRSDCKNKGYVLEGYPVTRPESFELFIEKIPVKNEEVEVMQGSDPEPAAAASPPAGDKSKPAPAPAAQATPAQPAAPSEIRYELVPRKDIMPDKVVVFSAENAAEVMTHLKLVVGDTFLSENKVTQEQIDAKFVEWTQKNTPEKESALDFFKEYKLEVISVPLKNYESKQKVFEVVSQKIDFSLKEPAADDEPSHDHMTNSSKLTDPIRLGERDAQGSAGPGSLAVPQYVTRLTQCWR